MKILFVTQHYLKGVGGGIFASRGYINAFAANASEMHLMYPFKKGYEAEGISKDVRMIPVSYDIPKWKKLINLIRGHMHRFYDVFEEQIARISPDIVVFDNSKCSDKLIDISHKYKTKVITIHHNYEYEYNRDNTRGILKPVILFWVKRIEGYAVNNSEVNLVLTIEDKKLLTDNYIKKKSKENIKLIGCFEYRHEESIKATSNTPDSNRFVITGNLSAIQTYKSLEEWFSTYLPVMRSELPGFTLTIAGKNPSEELKQFCNSNGIILHDSPKDMQPILENADYYICPTSLGGGLKLRIMDGLKNGLQVITHRVSARGYNVFEEKGILHSYSDRESFAKCIKGMADSKYTKEEIIGIYKDYFSFSTGIERIKSILSEMK